MVDCTVSLTNQSYMWLKKTNLTGSIFFLLDASDLKQL